MTAFFIRFSNFPAAVIMSFSFARVMATYNIRISSLRSARSFSKRSASSGMVVNSLYSRLSRRTQAKPICGCSAIRSRISCLLKLFAVSHKKTTGYSSHLDRWMLVTQTALSTVPAAAPSRSVLFSLRRSRKRTKPYRPPFPFWENTSA